MYYVLDFQPFERDFFNTKELVNETIVMLAAYPLLMCTAWIFEEQVRFFAGWVIVGCICMIIIFNITCFVFGRIRGLYNRIQRCMAMRKA